MQLLHCVIGLWFGVSCLVFCFAIVLCKVFFWEVVFKKMHIVCNSVVFCFWLLLLYCVFLRDGKKQLVLDILNMFIRPCRHWWVNICRFLLQIWWQCIYVWNCKVFLRLFCVDWTIKVLILLKLPWNISSWVLLEVVCCCWVLDLFIIESVKPLFLTFKLLHTEPHLNLLCFYCWGFGWSPLVFCGNWLPLHCIFGFLMYIWEHGPVFLCGLLFSLKLLFLVFGLIIGILCGLDLLEIHWLCLEIFPWLLVLWLLWHKQIWNDFLHIVVLIIWDFCWCLCVVLVLVPLHLFGFICLFIFLSI